MEGDGLEPFKCVVNNKMSPNEGAVTGHKSSNKIILKGLEVLVVDVFLCCDAFHQKKWMEREMKKLWALTTGQALATMTKMNNTLLWSAGATQASDFPMQNFWSSWSACHPENCK